MWLGDDVGDALAETSWGKDGGRSVIGDSHKSAHVADRFALAYGICSAVVE